jgi:hypothetical protein
MSSGGTEIQINSGERAISDDQNRAQRFREADLNELLRALVDTDCGLDDLQGSGADIRSSVSTAPLSATVFNGLVVRPQLGTLNVLVDQGVVGLYDPDATPNPDESQFKVIRDPGVTSGVPLVMTANASGSTRIDVIECARVAAPGYSVLETDNRDVFNPATGLFTPTTVNKVIAGRLQYRIRLGTPGGGFPANQVGWLPLAVASVPTGTITVNAMTFWDVRPFVGDRVLGPSNIASALPRFHNNRTIVDNYTSGGGANAYLSGYVEASATDIGVLAGTGLAGRYRLGGVFPTQSIDLNAAANKSGTVSNGAAYIYLIEPFGLPRWALYQVQSGALVPGNPRGIPCLSNVLPEPLFAGPSSALPLPPGTGLGGSSSKAVCIGATKFAGLCASMQTDGKTQVPGASPFAIDAGTIAGNQISWTITPGTNYPGHATAFWVTLGLAFNVAPTTKAFFTAATLDAIIGTTAAAEINLNGATFDNEGSATAGFSWTPRVKFPVIPGVVFTLTLTLTGLTNTTIGAGSFMVVDAWDVP